MAEGSGMYGSDEETVKRWEASGKSKPFSIFAYEEMLGRQAEKSAPENIEKYGTGLFSTDPKIAQGQKVGLSRAKELYGATPSDIGPMAKRAMDLREQRLSGTDPAMTAIREGRNRQLRMAKARGASEEELSQISRSAESDIGRAEEVTSGKRLSDYERAVTSRLRGITGTELGYAGLEKSGQQVLTPTSGGGILGDLAGTVICTELHRQGYMSDDILVKDRAYGANTRRTRPHVYFGYRFLASPVVKAMKSSPLFTKLISYPALAWARNMAGDHNISGKLISIIGEFVCGTVGKIINLEKRYGIQGTKTKA